MNVVSQKILLSRRTSASSPANQIKSNSLPETSHDEGRIDTVGPY